MTVLRNFLCVVWRNAAGYGILLRMKLILATAACALACSALAGTNDVPVLEEPVDSALQANAGADVRIREEIMHNVPASHYVLQPAS